MVIRTTVFSVQLNRNLKGSDIGKGA